jgi:hypothetical protein
MRLPWEKAGKRKIDKEARYTPNNFYARLTQVRVSGAEAAVLRNGMQGTDWLGTLTYPAGTSAEGDVTRLIAFGSTDGGRGGGSFSVRAYFNQGGIAGGISIGRKAPLCSLFSQIEFHQNWT